MKMNRTEYTDLITTSSSLITTGWKITLILLGTTGLLTSVVKAPGFWSSYVLDMVGPAWNYILLRGLYSPKNSSFLSLQFTPGKAALLILGICFLIETSQYFEIYGAHFDPYDYVAYGSLLLPVYLIDKWLVNYLGKGKKA